MSRNETDNTHTHRHTYIHDRKKDADIIGGMVDYGLRSLCVLYEMSHLSFGSELGGLRSAVFGGNLPAKAASLRVRVAIAR